MQTVSRSRTELRKWWPWAICFLLLLATALSYLDRLALSIAAPRIGEELHLNNAEIGQLLSVFFYAYGFMHLFVGVFLDRFNIRVVYALFVALWSISQILAGYAVNSGHLIASRVSLGIFESAGQPGAARIISRIVPHRDRSLANGIMMSGGSIGAMAAGPLVIFLTAQFGWRTAFVILGSLGLIWSLLFFFVFRPSPEVLYGKRDDETLEDSIDSWGTILRQPTFWACVCGAAFGIPIIHVSSSWVPLYFVQTWGLELKIDLAITLLLIYAGRDLGFISSGVAVSYFTRRGKSVEGVRKTVLVLAGVLMFSVAMLPIAPNVSVAAFILILMEIGRAAYGAVFLSLNQDISSKRVGTIAGIMGAIGAFSGATLVWFIGIISEERGLGVPFMIMGFMSVVGVIPLLLVSWNQSEAATETTEIIEESNA